jgi:cytochrome c5
VDEQHHDKSFIATFLGVLAFLVAFAVAISFIARSVSASSTIDPDALARVEERIKPAGAVVTDEKMLVALALAPAPAAAHAPMNGEQVVAKVCGACHGSGVLGAPKIGDKAEWAKRKAAGIAALVASAAKGKNSMPPRGGDASLTDDELKAAVQEMLKKTGV